MELMRVMLGIWWDQKGVVVYYELLKPIETILLVRTLTTTIERFEPHRQNENRQMP